jgi:hypothetical protein
LIPKGLKEALLENKKRILTAAHSSFDMYFAKDTLALDRIVLLSNQFKMDKPFTLSASMPITKREFEEKDMTFGEIECKMATKEQQKHLDVYIDRVFDLILS